MGVGQPQLTLSCLTCAGEANTTVPLVRPWDEETATTVEGAGLEREGAAVLVLPPPPRDTEGAEVTVASSISTSIYEATNTYVFLVTKFAATRVGKLAET
ncbi:unnamed protein product [Ixodes hexagonus]